MFLKVGIGNFLNNAEFIIKKDEEYACSYKGGKPCKMWREPCGVSICFPLSETSQNSSLQQYLRIYTVLVATA